MTAKKAEEKAPIVASGLTLQCADMNQARFKIDSPGKALRGLSVVTMAREVLPADYEPALYDVTGEITIKVTVTPKKK